MRAPGHEAGMRGGVEELNLSANLFQPAAKFGSGGTCQDPGTSAEQIGAGGSGAALLFAGHGVTADKTGATEMGRSGFAIGGFGAAGVGNERVRFHERIEMLQCFENPGNRLRKKDEVGFGGGLFERRAGIDCAALRCGFDTARRAHAGNRAGKASLAQGEPERGADQPHSDNRDVAHQMVRPTAAAIWRSCFISSRNWSPLSDCAPSLSALSGSWWTSMRSPSAPAAIAARAIGGT